MSLAILSYYLPTKSENYEELAKLTLPNRKEYCDNFGFNHFICSGPYNDPNMYYAYQRLLLLRDLMFNTKGDIEYYWVINIQAVITNMKKNVLDYVDPEHHFWITRDINGINAGSFIVKNSDRGMDWINFLISKEPEYRNDCWHEQRVIQHNENNPNYKDVIKVLDHPSINSYFYDLYNWPDTTPGSWKQGDLLLSLPGLNLKQRLDLVNSDRIKNAIIH